MTRQGWNEPTVERELGRGEWRDGQLERRLHEGCPCTEVVHLQTWNYDTDNSVPNVTWTDVAKFSAGGGFYEDVFYTPEPGMTWDHETGIITMVDDAEYECEGWVQFNESVVINNESRIVALNFGSSDRYIASHTFDIAHGSIAEHKLPVQTPRFVGSAGAAAVSLQCWQNSGGGLSIRDAEILVRKFEPFSSGTFETYDPFA